MEKEIEDTEFRLKLGSDLGRFDQSWDDNTLFECRYSRSKWFYFNHYFVRDHAPLQIYLRALKGNKNIIHITFSPYILQYDLSDVSLFLAAICDLPWVTSISPESYYAPDGHPTVPAHRDILFIKSSNNDLITFAKEIRLKMDPFSTYIFTDAANSDMRLGKLGNNARVLISFVAPTSGQCLILRLHHSGKEDLEVTLGSTIQLNHSSETSLMIDDITLYSIPGPSESDHLWYCYPV